MSRSWPTTSETTTKLPRLFKKIKHTIQKAAFFSSWRVESGSTLKSTTISFKSPVSSTRLPLIIVNKEQAPGNVWSIPRQSNWFTFTHKLAPIYSRLRIKDRIIHLSSGKTVRWKKNKIVRTSTGVRVSIKDKEGRLLNRVTYLNQLSAGQHQKKQQSSRV